MNGGRVGEIAARMAAVGRQIERQRYAGEDPVVELAPRLKSAEVVARVLAAERTGAALALDGARFNPQEDLAESALRGATTALRSWSFALARARLDEAGERAHDPALQQRVALFKALTRLVSATIYTPLDEQPRGGGATDLTALDEVHAGLDLLPAAERLHYRDEADRLLNLRDAARGGDAPLAAAWTLIRAQLAIGAGQDEAAILWLLHLVARNAGALGLEGGADRAYLADLVARARTRVLALIGVAEPAPAAGGGAISTPDDAKAVHPRELFNALVARLSAAFDRDLARGMEVFALNPYVAPDIADDATGRAEPKRRAGK